MNKERTPSPDSDKDANKKPAVTTNVRKKINAANLFSNDSDEEDKKKPSPKRPAAGKLKMPSFQVEEVKKSPKRAAPPKKVTVSNEDEGGDKDDFKKRLAGMLARGPRAPAVSSMASRGATATD